MAAVLGEAVKQHVAVLGKTGSGKTYAAKGIVEALLEQGRRVCIIDPTGVWWGLRVMANGQADGYPVVVFGGDHGDVPIVETSGAKLAALIAGRNLPCVIDVSEFGMGERHRFMTEFAVALYQENRQPLHLIVDEADEFAPQQPLPETRRMLSAIDRIVRRGRVRGFRVMLITQRPAVVHKNVLTQVHTMIAMRLTAPQDRKAVEEWVKGQADLGQAKDVLSTLARLQRGEGWVWAPEQDRLERVAFPLIRTFDSSRTPEDGEGLAEPVRLAPIEIADLSEMLSAEDAVKEKPGRKPKVAHPEPAALNAEYDRGYQDGQKTAQVEYQERLDMAWALLGRIDNALGGMTADVASAISKLDAPLPKPTTSPETPATAKPTPRRRANGTDGSLSGPQQRILDALAWWETMGVTSPARVQVAFAAGYSPKGSAFTNPLGALRSTGMVQYPGEGRVSLTSSGLAASQAPAAPGTRTELHRMVLNKLSGPQRRILEPLIEIYPEDLARPGLANRAGYSPDGSAFTNPLGSLRSLGLVSYPRSGHVVASDLLFP